MIPTNAHLGRIADALAATLVKKDLIQLAADSNQTVLRDRFLAVLRQNFAEEEELGRDAEAFADTHRREAAGMDRFKLVMLVKQRLAKERGFVL